MAMPSIDNPMESVAADELKTSGERVFGIALRSIVVPFVLSVVIWRVYGGSLSGLTCSFKADRLLLGLWPANLNYISQLHDSDFTQADQCWFFAVTSSTSVLYLVWLTWAIGRCISVLRQVRHIPGTSKYVLPKIGRFLFMVIGVGLGTAAGLQLLIGFEPSRGLHGLSTLLPIGWSASKVVFFIIPFSYFAVGVTANVLLLLLRYQLYLIKER